MKHTVLVLNAAQASCLSACTTILFTLILSACSGGDDSVSNSPETTGFVFSSAAADRYVRVDRTGQPAIASALLWRDPSIAAIGPAGVPLNPVPNNALNNQRDVFNRGDPINDERDFTTLMAVGPQPNSLRNIHYEAGPSLRALGLTPCSFETTSPPASNADIDISECGKVALPVVLPDVMTYNLDAAPGWPNGRGFDDPVIDRLLAAALLKVSGPSPPHTLRDFEGVLNPKTDESGTPSPVTFPHLRPAHP